MPILVQLVAMWVAKDIAAGRYPAKIAVPLSLLVSRLGAPGLLAGALGMAWNAYREQRTTGKARPQAQRRTAAAKKGRRA